METKTDPNMAIEKNFIKKPDLNLSRLKRVTSKRVAAFESWRRALSYESYENLIFYTLHQLTTKHYRSWGFEPYTYFEFGTGRGISLKKYLVALKRICAVKNLDIEDFNVILFDSFLGLPSQKEIQKDENPAWSEGYFMGTRKHIESIVDRTLKGKKPKIKFVEGFYETSLTDTLRKELSLSPPSLVNVDVDLYSSTKTLLNWIRPILQNGTVFHFDDVYEYLGSPFRGELAAIREFNEEYNFKDILTPFRNFGVRGFEGKMFTYSKIPQ